MATTEAQASATEKPAEPKGASPRKSTARKPAEGRTTLDTHLDAPSVTAPGDGPADTTDPTERASSATPDKGAAAMAGHGTVNAVVPLPERAVVGKPPKRDDRVEKYDAVAPDGSVVQVTHNLETGDTSTD